MRVVDVAIPASSRERVSDVLADLRVDFVIVPTADGEGVVVSIPVPAQGVEDVLGALDEVVDGQYTVVATAETASTEHMAELEERYVADDRHTDSVAVSELRSRALGMNPSALTYYSMTLLSAVVATAGLLLDAPTVVVGSMVIAPQVGTAMTTGVGTVLGDSDVIRDGARSQALGLVVAVAGAALFGVALRSAAFVAPALHVATVEQIGQRSAPGLLTLAVGLCAGAAGAFGLATALPVSLVGVMIAAALIPAAAAVGIGLAWGIPSMAQGAAVLLLVNVVSINASTVAVLWLLGYRPSGWEAGAWRSRRVVRDCGPTAVTALLLLGALVGSGVAVGGQVHATNVVNEEVSETLAGEPYRRVRLRSVHVEFDAPLADARVRTVSVTVSRPVEDRYPDLASTLDRRLTRALDYPVSVDVTVVAVQSTGRDQSSPRSAESRSQVPQGLRPSAFASSRETTSSVPAFVYSPQPQ